MNEHISWFSYIVYEPVNRMRSVVYRRTFLYVKKEKRSIIEYGRTNDSEFLMNDVTNVFFFVFHTYRNFTNALRYVFLFYKKKKNRYEIIEFKSRFRHRGTRTNRITITNCVCRKTINRVSIEFQNDSRFNSVK